MLLSHLSPMYMFNRFMSRFVQSDKKSLILPKMTPDRRKFVQEVNQTIVYLNTTESSFVYS